MTKINRRVFFLVLSALIALLALALLSEAASRFPNREKNNTRQGKPQEDLIRRRQELDARIPSTDYDAPEPATPDERAKRWKKNKHYDGGNWVRKNPSDNATAIVLDSHVFFALPPLPVAESSVIFSADVRASEAHLSNDKTGVYSEFNVEVAEVLKGTVPAPTETKLISLMRRGGKVRYFSGHVERYEIMGQNMPAIGKRYLFFLETIPDSQDYEILTGYEIDSTHVKPLDVGQFDAFRGRDVVAFINTVRDAIAKN